MRKVLSDLLAWWRAGQPVGMATMVATWCSARSSASSPTTRSSTYRRSRYVGAMGLGGSIHHDTE